MSKIIVVGIVLFILVFTLPKLVVWVNNKGLQTSKEVSRKLKRK